MCRGNKKRKTIEIENIRKEFVPYIFQRDDQSYIAQWPSLSYSSFQPLSLSPSLHTYTHAYTPYARTVVLRHEGSTSCTAVYMHDNKIYTI